MRACFSLLSLPSLCVVVGTSLLESPMATKEHYATVKKMRRVLLGARSTIPRQEPSDMALIGLINFLGGKETKLQSLVRHVDIGVHESLQPLKLLVEFMSFIVGGLYVEADKIEEAARNERRAVATLTHNIQRCEVELQYRHQYSGTNVTRALAQFYRTKRIYPSGSAANSKDFHIHELTEAISEDQIRLREAKSKLRVLVVVLRYLWGTGNVQSGENVERLLCDFSVTLAIRRFNHKLRDIMIPLSEEARNSLRCLASLEEFIAHVDIGLSAATEDLEVCLVSLKKHILMQDEDSRVRCINATRDRSSMEVSRAFGVLRPMGRRTESVTETEELSRLYCS